MVWVLESDKALREVLQGLLQMNGQPVKTFKNRSKAASALRTALIKREKAPSLAISTQEEWLSQIKMCFPGTRIVQIRDKKPLKLGQVIALLKECL